MRRLAQDARGKPLLLLSRPSSLEKDHGKFSQTSVTDWKNVNRQRIGASLSAAQQKPSGGWYVLDDSRTITRKPKVYWVEGLELVAWRCNGELSVGPNRCPHMGAPLSAGEYRNGRLVCPWHGMSLCSERRGSWRPLQSFDDGQLAWVQITEEHLRKGLDSSPSVVEKEQKKQKEQAILTSEPILPTRPRIALRGVMRMVVHAEVEDVIANRLDPWHGAHFHPHSFARLRVLSEKDGVLKVQVAFRLLGPFCVEVVCTFQCIDPRTIVMTIVEGEGKGSIVETHATPMAPGWSSVTELTMASSDKEGFRHALKAQRLLEPLLRFTARRLWAEDAAYAERTYTLRNKAQPTPESTRWWTTAPGTPKNR